MNIKKLIVVTGPTGVGKTELTLQIAELLGTSIINADSRQLFREIPIGTAAPTDEQMRRVKHYFVGTHGLDDYYSASMFEQDVMSLLENLPGDVALLSGGSMMYIDAVCQGIDDIPTVRNEIRQELIHRLETEGLPQLVDELERLDPDYCRVVDRNNPRRVLHALEICRQTGRTYSSFRTNIVKRRPFDIVKIVLNREREELYERINQRVVDMLATGMVDEALRVYAFRSNNSLNTVGYKELFDYLDGLATFQETVLRIQSNTRRYARKQITWLRRDERAVWFHPDKTEEILNYIGARQRG
ncbi:tRNA delta(2)-isopentenylpyrophosphate transferase [Prevotella micans F0438]|uniref:tRNA dimethylallyltransferase n=1 Tax=Prevotella micans F0438 TaxID=883158 RepID=H1PZQ3_9BACT|nr:tRNA (adenosine(37)-N6)-dimethylallyltransferase MiaA [Prevotella micans]EHO74814.1 tRNA delta(2)-isopentenylpyrophosphate transferase [Prevotella micans F0438]